MDNLIKKYTEIVDNAKNFYDTKKNLAITIIIGIILLLGLISYLTTIGRKIDQGDFRDIMDSSITYINESKTLKEQSLAETISTDDFNKRKSEIQEEVKKINEKLHTSEFDPDVNIDKDTIKSAGNAIEGLVAVILESNSLDTLQDEILALSIILENMKNGDESA